MPSQPTPPPPPSPSPPVSCCESTLDRLVALHPLGIHGLETKFSLQEEHLEEQRRLEREAAEAYAQRQREGHPVRTVAPADPRQRPSQQPQSRAVQGQAGRAQRPKEKDSCVVC